VIGARAATRREIACCATTQASLATGAPAAAVTSATVGSRSAAKACCAALPSAPAREAPREVGGQRPRWRHDDRGRRYVQPPLNRALGERRPVAGLRGGAGR